MPYRRVMIRSATQREFVMVEPTYFDVSYAINPWMDPSRPVDTAEALKQWARLRDTYVDLGHRVEVIEAVPGLPDMVFTANGGFIIDGSALCSRFAFAQREPEAQVFAAWFEATGLAVHELRHVNEGEGDFRLVGSRILAASPYRTARAAHAEVASLTGREVVSLELVDPRFYHLDTALAVLDDETVGYFPPAFSVESQAVLSDLFPDAILAGDADAGVLGLNVASDGRHVVMTDAAPVLAQRLREAGFETICIDVSEFLGAGGGVKCCTLEVRR
jgi:ornithine--oxo-acid transaminase